MFELRKRTPPVEGSVLAGQLLAREDGLYPALVQMLTMDKYPDGSRRVPSSFSVFNQDGVLKASLNDKDAELVAYVSADTITGLLEALEAGLQGDHLDWRKGGRRIGKKR